MRAERDRLVDGRWHVVSEPIRAPIEPRASKGLAEMSPALKLPVRLVSNNVGSPAHVPHGQSRLYEDGSWSQVPVDPILQNSRQVMTITCRSSGSTVITCLALQLGETRCGLLT